MFARAAPPGLFYVFLTENNNLLFVCSQYLFVRDKDLFFFSLSLIFSCSCPPTYLRIHASLCLYGTHAVLVVHLCIRKQIIPCAR